jgi:hypothetical protein
MRDERCPHCHQVLHHERLGVRLTPLKARILDMIKAAGDLGIAREELMHALARERGVAISKYTLKAHIWQINDLLEETNFVIAYEPRDSEPRASYGRWAHIRPRQVSERQDGRWFLRRRRLRAVA